MKNIFIFLICLLFWDLSMAVTEKQLNSYAPSYECRTIFGGSFNYRDHHGSHLETREPMHFELSENNGEEIVIKGDRSSFEILAKQKDFLNEVIRAINDLPVDKNKLKVVLKK